jgi:hypothetical protein
MPLIAPRVPIAAAALSLALAVSGPALASTHRVQQKTVAHHKTVQHSTKLMSVSTANCPNMGSSSTSPASFNA